MYRGTVSTDGFHTKSVAERQSQDSNPLFDFSSFENSFDHFFYLTGDGGNT